MSATKKRHSSAYEWSPKRTQRVVHLFVRLLVCSFIHTFVRSFTPPAIQPVLHAHFFDFLIFALEDVLDIVVVSLLQFELLLLELGLDHLDLHLDALFQVPLEGVLAILQRR